jgi:uncharacterized damage-inducible protein DinB
MIGTIRKYVRYHLWAFEKTIEVMESVETPAKSIELLDHTFAIDTLFVFRILNGGLGSYDLVVDYDAVKARFSVVRQGWEQVISRLNEEEFDRTVHYENTGGEPFTNTVGELLLHTINHGTHHRAQIATLVRSAGGEPEMIDNIVFLRQDQPQGG